MPRSILRDDAAQVVSIFVDDVLLSTRPYSAEEIREAEVLSAAKQERLVRETNRATIKAIITDLKAEKDRAQAVIDDAAATKNEKNLGRAAKRIADAAIDLARFVQNS